jgi:predicted nucleic acid-binding protein
MISFDTNLLLYSLNQDCPEYNEARASFVNHDMLSTVNATEG